MFFVQSPVFMKIIMRQLVIAIYQKTRGLGCEPGGLRCSCAQPCSSLQHQLQIFNATSHLWILNVMCFNQCLLFLGVNSLPHPLPPSQLLTSFRVGRTACQRHRLHPSSSIFFWPNPQPDGEAAVYSPTCQKGAAA